MDLVIGQQIKNGSKLSYSKPFTTASTKGALFILSIDWYDSDGYFFTVTCEGTPYYAKKWQSLL